MIVLSVRAGIALFKIKPNAVEQSKTYLIISVITTAFSSLFVYGNRIYETRYEAIAGFISIIAPFIFFAIWYSYLNVSQRVIVTYEINSVSSFLFNNKKVIRFYEFTSKNWRNQSLENSKIDYYKFLDLYGHRNGILEYFFSNFTPNDDEYLIEAGEREFGIERGWFILTNYRLIIKDGLTNEFCILNLSDIDSLRLSSDISKPCVFRLKSGESKEINNVEICPNEDYLKSAINGIKN